MIALLISSILVLDYVVLVMSSRCAKIEEKMYISEFKKNIED